MPGREWPRLFSHNEQPFRLRRTRRGDPGVSLVEDSSLHTPATGGQAFGLKTPEEARVSQAFMASKHRLAEAGGRQTRSKRLVLASEPYSGRIIGKSITSRMVR
jgi:hypothetical protein